MKKELLDKLKNYSKTAAVVAVAGGTANAQIIYTDVDADVTLNTFPSNYEIDFDGDGNVDIKVDLLDASSNLYFVQLLPEGTNTSVVGESGSYVAVLNTSNLISSSNNFLTTSYNLLMGAYRYVSSTTSSTITSTTSFGYWQPGETDKYAGVKFDISGETHYGWIRLSTSYTSLDDMSVTIKDFAYQAIADSAIYAGSVQADTAYSVLASDVADNKNGLDLQVDFTKADNETLVSEYRIMVVKSADATTFDLATAEAVVSDNYTAIAPTGSNISTVLTETSKDVDGDAIANDIAYKVFVLSIAPNTSLHNINVLSSVSNEVTLVSPADTAYNVLASDVADNKNGLDLKVDFTKADDETTVSEYRIMVVKSANADAFDLTVAEAVISDNYTAKAPTGNNISTVLTETSKDVNGDAVTNDVAYKVFVLSIADGTNTTINNLSSESNEVTLTTIEDNIVELEMISKIYPNPASDILNIELQKNDNYTVKLMDLSGKVLITNQFEGRSVIISVNQLPKADYLLSIDNGHATITKQIIVK